MDDIKSMHSNFNFLDILNALKRAQDRNLDVQLRQFFVGYRIKSRIFGGSTDHTMPHNIGKFMIGKKLANAAPEFLPSVQGHERTFLLIQCIADLHA